MTRQPVTVKDARAQLLIREMRLCNRICPAFTICPLMPLSIQPDVKSERMCLLNTGPETVRRVYMHLFVDGESGIVDEIKGTVLEYGKLLRETKVGMTVKERMRHLKELNGMMLALHKILAVSGKGVEEGERVEVMGVEDEPDPESLEFSPVAAEIMERAAGKGVPTTAAEEQPVVKLMGDTYINKCEKDTK